MCGVVTPSSYHMDASARLLGTSSPVHLLKINIFSLSLITKRLGIHKLYKNEE